MKSSKDFQSQSLNPNYYYYLKKNWKYIYPKKQRILLFKSSSFSHSNWFKACVFVFLSWLGRQRQPSRLRKMGIIMTKGASSKFQTEINLELYCPILLISLINKSLFPVENPPNYNPSHNSYVIFYTRKKYFLILSLSLSLSLSYLLSNSAHGFQTPPEIPNTIDPQIH